MLGLRRLLPVLGVWLTLSIIVGTGFLVSFWPFHPHSIVGWVLLLVTALLLAALGEFLGDRVIFHSDIGAALNSLGHGFLSSLVRILYVLFMFLALAAIASLILKTLNAPGWVSAL
jgi:uncharacterized membrane protein